MSAPNTNIETQKRRHKGPLIGILVGVAIAVAMFIALMGYVADKGGVPEGAEVQIDGRTGQPVPAENE